MAGPLHQTLIALRLDGKPLPNDTPGSWFIGVGCRRCGIIYALEVTKENQSVSALPTAVNWVESQMGLCGAHPGSLVHRMAEEKEETVRSAALSRWASGAK